MFNPPSATDPSNPGSLLNLHTIPVNGHDTVFVMLCTILVLLMIPGLGIFYLGLARKKYAQTIMMQCIISIPITVIIWIFGGFGLVFGSNIGGGFLGNPELGFAFNNLLVGGTHGAAFGPNSTFVVNVAYAPHVPFILFWLFQLMFAIITPPLMVGAFSERMTWGKYIVYLILWQYFVYIPVAHWIWGGGFLALAGVVDWAGGIVIHTTAGVGALVTAAMLGRRKFRKAEKDSHSSIGMMFVGTAMLLFGWFGFNSGGAMAINGSAMRAFFNTAVAPTFAVVVWIIAEKIWAKKVSDVGICAAFVAGLATITPAAGYVDIWASCIIGAVAGFVCYVFVEIINHTKKVDDALDVFGVHGMGGITGAILIGLLAVGTNAGASTAGTLINLHNGYQFGLQIGAVALTAAWTALFTAPIVFITQKTPLPWGFKTYKPSMEEEQELWEEEEHKEAHAEEIKNQYFETYKQH